MRRIRQVALPCMVAVLAASCAGPMHVRTAKLAAVWVDRHSTAEREDGSADAPYKSITTALKAAGPGDRVTVRAGKYHETLRLPCGAPDRPFVLSAAPGERVIVTGAQKLTGWERHSDHVWTTTLDWQPERLFAGLREQPVARAPNHGWWETRSAVDNTFADPPNLKEARFDPAGGTVTMLLKEGGKHQFTIAGFDPRKGAVSLNERSLGRRTLAAGDLYFLQNRASLIDRPGEWAVEKVGREFKVYFRPTDEGDLRDVDCPKAEIVVHANKVKHVRIEGLEVTGGLRKGILAQDCEDIVITRCVVHDIHKFKGIQSLDCRNVTISRNISTRNAYGIAVDATADAVVEENEVFGNAIDGLLVTWGSSNVLVRRNSVHHHLLWGHPDSIQLYRDVQRVRFIDNLLLCSGQSMMMQGTSDGEIAGNMIVGSRATMVILGHGSARNYKVHNNTIAFGRKPVTTTADGYDVRDNVMMAGHDHPIFSIPDVDAYQGDHNLFFCSTRVRPRAIATMGRKWFATLEEHQQATGQNVHSVYADPRFVNAPIGYAALDFDRLNECTPGRLYLTYGAETFRVGDNVEVNFDGVRRQVRTVEEKVLTIAPPCSERPSSGWVVANWGENEDFALDLRLRPSSPGARLAADGGTVGSSVDIQAYLKGDFDGDGQRDIPELPTELRADGGS